MKIIAALLLLTAPGYCQQLETINGGRANITLAHGLLADRPATCKTGQHYEATDATAGANFYLCISANTWAAQGGGGASAAGPTDAVQTKGVSGLAGSSAFTFNATKGLGLSIPDSADTGDGNYHHALYLNYNTNTLAKLNFGYPTEAGLVNNVTVPRGFNDDVISGASSKLTVLGFANTVYSPGAGQRFGISNAVNCFGMGDCYAVGQSVYQWGGLNADGDEGTGHKRNTLSQGVYLAQGNISSVPAQSQCRGTLAQAVTRSNDGVAQSVNFTRTSAAGTCLKDEYVDIQRGPIYADGHHEVTQLTADYSGGQITAVFESNHENGGAVSPATVLNVDNTGNFGELRQLVNLTSPRHAGTISGVGGVTVSLNDTIAASVVGGDSTVPGVISLDQDEYTGYPFSTGDTTKLHAFYGIQGVLSSTSLAVGHKDAAGTASYHGLATAGGGYQIFRAARVWRLVGNNTVVLENNSFTWTAGDLVECAISTEGNVANTNFFQWWMPGAALYDAENILNTGARTFGAALSIGTRMASGSNSDRPWAWGRGIAIGGAKVGLALDLTQTAAIQIATNYDISAYNTNVCWGNCDIRIGPNANPLQPGQLSIGPFGTGPSLDFGDAGSLASNGLFQMRWRGMVTLLGTSGGNAGQLQLGNDDGSGGIDAVRLVKSGSAEMTFHAIETTAGTDVELFGISGNAGGPYLPKKGVATAGVNYGSQAFVYEATLWNGGGVTRTLAANTVLNPTSGATGAPLSWDVILPANCVGNFYYGYANTALSVRQDGVLTFGINNTFSPCYPTTATAMLRPTGLTALRTFDLPDASGTVAVSGAGQAVSFGGLNLSALPTTCTAQPTHTVAAISGVLTLCP